MKKRQPSAYDANERVPLFQLNSVLEWQGHRKHRLSESLQRSRERAVKVAQLYKKQKEEEARAKADWAGQRV